MKNKIKRKMSVIAIGLFGLLGLSMSFCYAQTNLAPDAAAATVAPDQSAQPAVQRGTLFRVRHQGNTSYLFGTIHVGKPEFYPLGSAVDYALSQASKIVVELDIQQTDAIRIAMQEHGMFGAGDSIEKHLSPARLARLKLALEKVNIPLESVMQMRPWLVVNLLLELDLERAGYVRAQGIEEHLLKTAKQQKKQVLELESADFQFSLFNRLSASQQEQYLDEVLTEIQDGKSRSETERWANAWMRADPVELARLMAETWSEKSVTAEFTRRVLLEQRNPGMADKIEGLLKQDRVTFVGVGLLHLIGEMSVPVLLRQRGYVVEKLY